MRPFSALLSTVFAGMTVVANDTSPEEPPIVRFDGVYRTDKQPFDREVVTIDGEELDGSYSYLRFYADGTVISTTSTGTAREIMGWFQRGQEHILQGQYSQTKGRISFSVISPVGSVDYAGSLQEGKLVLHSRSNINGYESDNIFNFVALPSGPG